MPRSISAEQRQKLKAELLESDDDMDDILQPSLLHPSNRTTPQVSPQSSTNSNKADKVETEIVYTRKELEEQAMKNARNAIERVLSIKCFPKIANATDIKWLRTGGKIWPVFVNHDPSNAQVVNVGSKNKQIIEYIGDHMLDTSTIQPVLARSLTEYGEEMSWNPEHMAAYTKQLKHYRPFKEQKGQAQQRMILEEQYFLELLLKKQFEFDQKTMDGTVDDDDGDDQEEEFRYTASEDTMKDQYRKLRAGDIIDYKHPVFIDQTNRAMIIKAMPPPASRRNANDTVLYLSDGQVLQRETEVRLVKRFIRGTLVDNPNGAMMFLWDFKFDASRNGKFTESDFEKMMGGNSGAKTIQEAFDVANKQVEEEIMKLVKRGSASNEHDTPRKGRKRTRQEDHALNESETTKSESVPF
ncbi:hypothetical protein FisN_2Lh165 [Fistulifera solaris]|uniref:EF-hand domain-containing protein n=1 Tax=Fistulifera solaris TaxID=1519565 RepID=A0A1Z5KEZ7_FISSO|nr:hypothetical protein FisN_2Lh165 [Fistulifera solaris]|eukprot:GAX24894.1 hypothetical protein FisN_2Lh165 [Fistulifera solaris]